ncbi:MAG: 4Fe-4S binding protein, partial [Kiritimatiellae bacterium]|nr:4Fe-4S binding protein [Kiritimatiellia bacterium]
MGDIDITPRASHGHAWHALRIVFLLLSALLALQILPWRTGARIVPSLSPFLNLSSALAARSLAVSALLAVPLLVMALLRSRWFCGHLCPMGYCAALASRVHHHGRARYKKWPNLGPWLLLLGLGGAAAGYPLFIWLDPLSIFNGFFSAWRQPVLMAYLLPAAGFVVILLISLAVPNLWCQRLCPLGALQSALGALGKSLRRGREVAARESAPDGAALGRRSFLGIVAGGAAGLAARHALGREVQPIRPPGAAPEETLSAL